MTGSGAWRAFPPGRLADDQLGFEHHPPVPVLPGAAVISSTSSPAAIWPISADGWRTEDSGTAAAPANSMSSYPMIAISPGTDTPAAYSACSTPSASRSLAQNTAVGTAGQREQPAARLPAGGHVHPVRLDLRERVLGQAMGGDRGQRAVPPVPALGEAHRPAHVGDELVAGLDQVGARHPAARNVIDRDRAALGRHPVHQHERDLVAPQDAEVGSGRVGRA